MPLKNLAKAAGLAVAVPAAAMGGVKLVLDTTTKVYTSKMFGTPEEQRASMPGDDLVVDPNGLPLKQWTMAKTIDAHTDEVWKHLYQQGINKAGYYSYVIFERMFGMNVNNAYSVEEMWQGDDAYVPGDFWSWGYMGYGAEVCDLVPGKYIVWAGDSRRPPSAPGSTAIAIPGYDYIVWSYVNAVVPVDGGKRTRVIVRATFAYGPHNLYTDYVLDQVMFNGGELMGTGLFKGLERSATFTAKKSVPMRFWESIMGRSHGAPDDLHKSVPYPELRWGRDCPWVEDVRAPITDDPNWPPASPDSYVAPIAENNEKAGWTPQKKEQNRKVVEQKYAELRAKIAESRK